MERKYLKRDDDSGAILNTNRAQYLNYKKKKRDELEKEVKLEKLEDDIQELKNSFDRIESLLIGLTNGKS